MLSIIPIRGDGTYYTSLGRDDYYLNPGEPRGVWLGAGAEVLGLTETVDDLTYRRVMAGFSPDGETPLVRNAGTEVRRPGWDLTFSAPKSVSEVWAALGIILHIDLPDFPRVVRFAALQAKKLDGTAQRDKSQFQTLRSAFPESSAYLFYDTDFKTLAPPLVVAAERFQDASEEDAMTKSFAVSANVAFDGLPLSLWLFSQLAREQAGESVADFAAAMRRFTRQSNERELFGGRLAVLSVGRRLRLTRDIEAGLRIEV